MTTTNKGISTGAKAGLGIAAIAAAAGAYYFYGSKHAPSNRKQMKGWMIKAKGELVEKMEKMKDISQASYEAAVNQITEKYGKLKDIDPQDLQAMAHDFKRHWKSISSQMKPAVKKAVAKKTR